MDEKTKENILGTIGVIGVIVAMVTALLLFGPYFEVYLIPIDENLGIWLLTIGITLAVLGLGSAISIARTRVRKLIANFAEPILQSKGKVSLREIWENVKAAPDDAEILREKYIEPMLRAGYFKGARLEGGWLIRDMIPCPYCGQPVRLTDKECSRCGAPIMGR